MKKVKEYTKLMNCNYIEWQTPIFNTKAIMFYNKIGAFSKTKEHYTLKV